MFKVLAGLHKVEDARVSACVCVSAESDSISIESSVSNQMSRSCADSIASGGSHGGSQWSVTESGREDTHEDEPDHSNLTGIEEP